MPIVRKRKRFGISFSQTIYFNINLFNQVVCNTQTTTIFGSFLVPYFTNQTVLYKCIVLLSDAFKCNEILFFLATSDTLGVMGIVNLLVEDNKETLLSS